MRERMHRVETLHEGMIHPGSVEHPVVAGLGSSSSSESSAAVDGRLPEILHWIADGWTQSKIADRLGVTQPCVSSLLRRLRQRRAG
jgi:DNA-binding NarL/FixJ family response regulator